MRKMSEEEFNEFEKQLKQELEENLKILQDRGWVEDENRNWKHPETGKLYNYNQALHKALHDWLYETGWTDVTLRIHYPHFDESYNKRSGDYMINFLHPTTNKIHSWFEAVDSLTRNNEDIGDEYLCGKTKALRILLKDKDIKKGDIIHYDFLNEELNYATIGDCNFILKRIDRSSDEKKKSFKNGLQSKARSKRIVQEGNFTLASGIPSNIFVDATKLTLDKEAIVDICVIIRDKIKDIWITNVGGPATGAIPIVAGMTYHFDVNGFYVKKKGNEFSIEGNLFAGDKVLMVEDVVTTGQSLMNAVKLVEEKGATVYKIIPLIDRQQGASQLFKDYDYDPILYLEDIR